MYPDVLGVPLLHKSRSLFFIDFIAGYMYPDVLGVPLLHKSRSLFFIDFIAGYMYPDVLGVPLPHKSQSVFCVGNTSLAKFSIFICVRSPSPAHFSIMEIPRWSFTLMLS